MKILFLLIIPFSVLSVDSRSQNRKGFELYPVNMGIGFQSGSQQVVGNRFALNLIECNYVFKNQQLVGIRIGGTTFKDALYPDDKFGLLFASRELHQLAVVDIHAGKIYELNSLNLSIEIKSGIGLLMYDRTLFSIPTSGSCGFSCKTPTRTYESLRSYTVPMSAKICFGQKHIVGPALTFGYNIIRCFHTVQLQLVYTVIF